ncbi:nuclear transport factor 2 family protein [Flavobacterium sp. LS1R49]|uniref:Nuclear transport factor 2 family protein n=1 Tax=Flavobacterium shii TaxID=2987687 RepID=A0A9X2ZAE3_9FLAO|nr:nuclear transport factor 2 family protein [Flavobacterium shii]MCV9927159.1 nuclear transport factor 2 family protein [Flavobacterium shii]
MPKLETVERFISMVESNEHDTAIAKFYTEDATMQENQSEPRVGRDFLVANEKNVLARVKSLVSKCIRPVFINDDFVVIQWYFKFEWKDGTISEIEEIAYQNWEGELIKKEKFFYDPKQFIPV